MRNDRALGEEIYNEVDPSSSVFAGHMIHPKDWKNDFPMFLCNCARNAKAKGYDHFGVNNFGEKTKKLVFFFTIFKHYAFEDTDRRTDTQVVGRWVSRQAEKR